MEYDDKLHFQLIGRRVHDFRMDRGLTQEGLAEAAELSVPYVSHIERRKRKPAFQPLSCLPLHWGSRWILRQRILQGDMFHPSVFRFGSICRKKSKGI